MGAPGAVARPGDRFGARGRPLGRPRPSGAVVDRSPNWNSRRLPPDSPSSPEASRIVGTDGRGWRTRSVELRAPEVGFEPSAPFRRALVIEAFLPMDPSEATLRQLALALAVLAGSTWGVAAVLGRWFCRRALSPLTRMAEAARRADIDGSGPRLPVPDGGDELRTRIGVQ